LRQKRHPRYSTFGQSGRSREFGVLIRYGHRLLAET
jgi:hypothetical protein